MGIQTREITKEAKATIEGIEKVPSLAFQFRLCLPFLYFSFVLNLFEVKLESDGRDDC